MKQIKKRKASGVLAEMLKNITPESLEKTRVQMEQECQTFKIKNHD